MTGLSVASFLVMVVMAVGMALVRPIRALFDMSNGVGMYALRFFCIIAGNLVYIVAHEAVHGFVMKRLGAQSVRFGFNGIYAWAGSELDYFERRGYILVALAPAVFFGVLLSIGCLLVPADWFWVLYLIQIGNISGSVGDFYVVMKLAGVRGELRIRDTGTNMTIYRVEK